METNERQPIQTVAITTGSSSTGNSYVEEILSRNDVIHNSITLKSSTVCSQLRHVVGQITVEPVMFLFMLAGSTYYPAFQSLLYHKNSTYSDEEDVVQGETAVWMLYEHVCFEVPSLFLSFFYGPLSDNVSRKYTMMLPLLGQVLSMLTYVMSAVFIDHHVGYVLIGRVISGLFGGWIGCSLAAFSYLSAVTDEHNRTTRIAVVEGFSLLGKSVAFFCSGALLHRDHYILVFSVAVGMNLLGVMYVACCIKEPHRPDGQRRIQVREIVGRIQESLSCVFKKRDGKERLYLLTVLGSLFMATFSYQVIVTLGYLYVKRHPLRWSQTLYGIYLGIRSVASGLCLLVVVPYMKNILKFRDTTIVLMSLVASAVSEVFFGLSIETWMVFAVAVLAMLADAKFSCMRSIMSKLVKPDEFGKLFAAIGCLQSMGGMLGTAMYNGTYPATLHIWPGMCFIIGASATFIPIGIFIWLHVQLRNGLPVFSQLEEETI